MAEKEVGEDVGIDTAGGGGKGGARGRRFRWMAVDERDA